MIYQTYVRRSSPAGKGLLDFCDPAAARRRALFQVQQVTRGRYGDMPVLLVSPARVGWTIRAPRWPRRRLRAHGTSVCTCSPPSPSSVKRADWRRCRESPNVPRKCRRGRGPRLPPTGSASTAWRASVRPSWAPIHSDLHPHPYGGRIAVAERHWDGSARRRNVDSVTTRVGDR